MGRTTQPSCWLGFPDRNEGHLPTNKLSKMLPGEHRPAARAWSTIALLEAIKPPSIDIKTRLATMCIAFLFYIVHRARIRFSTQFKSQAEVRSTVRRDRISGRSSGRGLGVRQGMT